ncbi:DUF1570 domain-containing protein [Aeoliella sp.]|uniref:DUF1570 domain-containing protein n=1 Tax=Aeoliella sp. TaxID=2795800 RepID=UPI003CCC29E2
MIRTSLLFALATFAIPMAHSADFMFAAIYDGEAIEGRPLMWNDHEMLILARDGALHTVDPRIAEDAHKTAPQFQGYSTSEMRSALYEEFGRGMTVTSTGHYLVVHRPGESDAWASRFEELYRSFQNYFRVRGIELRRPKFPLVAVIYGSQQEYYAAARKAGSQLGPNTLGHYDPTTNRVLMYDRVGNNDRDWGVTANTIVHEATHQMAFNTGLHSRTAASPQWVVEGLATMFEARGVYQSNASDTRQNRINRGRLDDYFHFVDTAPTKQTLAELVASDTPFRTSAQRAYAEAWALTFYLSETRPREYEQYLALTASREPLSKYGSMERVRDFQSVFGSDLTLLESNYRTWMNELR